RCLLACSFDDQLRLPRGSGKLGCDCSIGLCTFLVQGLPGARALRCDGPPCTFQSPLQVQDRPILRIPVDLST
ncbi:MAG TPA: hypothetical protein VFQ61_10435, partial [Polyangiaceae bacterium]|nr:hypothetical protein [Polyangiaceae bacterium]